MIDIRDLNLSFDDRRILNEINIQVTNGEIIGIIGKTGAGKSMLLKTIAGKFKNYTGSIRLNNKPHGSMSKKEKLNIIAFIIKKSFDNIIDETIYNYLLLARKAKKKKLSPYTEYDFQIVEHYIQLFQLGQYKDQKILSIPDGIFKKANLAFSFITEAQMVLLDNPTNGLDLHSKYLLQKTLQKYVIDGKHLSIIASNDLNFISQSVDKIVLLDSGKIITEGPPDIITSDLIKEYFELDVLISKNIYNGKPIVHLNLGN